MKVTTLPAVGSLKLHGVAVAANDFVAAADIAAGKLEFFPAANGNGAGYESFNFRVQDNGGTANGGDDLADTANTITVDVVWVNGVAVGCRQDGVDERDTAYTFATADFGFTEPATRPRTRWRRKVTTLPAVGSLKLYGVAVAANDFVAAADIAAGKLNFFPAANGNGAGYASFNFRVQDNGGTANGGDDLADTANTITVDVVSVNDAPLGADKTVSTNEDTAYMFATADFGFTDPSDTPANALAAVKVTTLPAVGSLKLDGVAVAANDFVAAADIAAGKLKFFPAANGNRAGYASFNFRVQDNGGTANGGDDLADTADAITVDVISVKMRRWVPTDGVDERGHGVHVRDG